MSMHRQGLELGLPTPPGSLELDLRPEGGLCHQEVDFERGESGAWDVARLLWRGRLERWLAGRGDVVFGCFWILFAAR